MRKIKIILLFIMVTFLAVGCIDNKIMKKEISLDSIGSQGDIRQDYVAFQILDNSFMGLRSLCVKKSVVSNLFSDYSKCHLNINGTYFYLNENPFNNNILEVDLPDSLTEENIRKGILTTSPAKKNTSTSARSGISIDSIVIQKEEAQNNSDLFRIAASLFISMRNANIFVFNKQGDFIIPSYIFTSEENCYMVSTFISARNASPNPSINGTFEFLKSLQNHNELLQHINPNTARYENGKIVIYPPNGKKRLRDLGSEGELNLQSSVYKITDLRGSLGLWSVAFRKSRLPEPEKNGTDWKITLKNTEYLFTQNIVDGDIYELTIPDSITNDIEEIRNSTFETVEDQIYTLTIEASPTNGGDVRIGIEAWGDNKSKTFNYGESVTIEASCSSDYFFDGWYENQIKISSDNPYSFSLVDDRNIKANFVKKYDSPNIELVYPENNATEQAIILSLSWQASTGSQSNTSPRNVSITGYRLYLAKTDENFGVGEDLSSTSKQVNLDYGTSYKWKVEVFQSDGKSTMSDTWTFTTVYRIYNVPSIALLSPADGATEQATQLTLSWQGTAGGQTNASPRDVSITGYKVYVAKNGEVYGAGEEENGTTKDVELDYASEYKWKVEVFQNDGKSTMSDEATFSTVERKYAAPTITLLSPADGATEQATQLTLSWQGTAGSKSNSTPRNVSISGNRLYLTKSNEDFGTGIDLTSDSTDVQLDYGTSYKWKVEVFQSDGQSSISDVWSFSTKDNIKYDLEFKNTQASTNEKFNAYIKNNKVMNISGFNLTISYEEEYLSIEDIQNAVQLYGDLSDSMKIIKKVSPGILKITIANENPVTVSEENIISIQFLSSNEVSNPKISFIKEDCEFIDENLNPIEINYGPEIAIEINENINNKMKIMPENSTVNENNIFSLPLKAINLVDITGMEFTIEYNTEYLDLPDKNILTNNFILSTGFENMLIIINEISAGKYKLFVSSPGDQRINSISSTLLNIKLNAKKECKSTDFIVKDMKFIDSNFNEIITVETAIAKIEIKRGLSNTPKIILTDIESSSDTEFDYYISAEYLLDVAGMDLIFNIPTEYISLENTNKIFILSPISNSMKIIKLEADKLYISIAFLSNLNINSRENILLIKFKSKNTIGESYIELSENSKLIHSDNSVYMMNNNAKGKITINNISGGVK